MIERTEGNPFFLEESVRTLAETQASRWERRARIAGERLYGAYRSPTTVQSAPRRTPDRSPPPTEKRSPQLAAVIGNESCLRFLQAIAELPDEALLQRPRQLQTAGFLYERTLFPEPNTPSRHALTCEVAMAACWSHVVVASRGGRPGLEELCADRTEEVAGASGPPLGGVRG